MGVGTNDLIFFKEFRDMMNGRRGFGKSLNMVELPLPELKTMSSGEPKGHMAVVKNIKEPFFSNLNGKEVRLIGRTTLKKRQVLSDGTFRRDSSGNFVCTQIPVKNGFVAILSDVSIGLKRKHKVNGVEKVYSPPDGFRYVDFVNTEGGRKYIYIVPKDNVYRLNLCALILTPNKHRVFYKGAKLAVQNGNYLYAYVIPYKHRDTSALGYRVLGTKASTNFNIEVNQILKLWVELGILFNLNLTSLENSVNGINNVGVMNLEGSCSSEEYKPFLVSLAEEKDFKFEQSIG